MINDKLEKQKRLRDLTHKEIPEARQRVATSQRSLADLEREGRKLVIELTGTGNNNDIRVSDHAVLRYIERVLKFDVDAIRKQILTPERIGYIKAGASSINVDGTVFVVKDKTIVTTLDK